MTFNNRVIATIPLDCGHEIRLMHPQPKLGERLYCVRCELYVLIGPPGVMRRIVRHAGWRSVPLLGARLRGECSKCPYKLTRDIWIELNSAMDNHVRKHHPVTLAKLVDADIPLKYRPKPSTDGPPPF